TEHQLTLDDDLFGDNNERLNRQKESPITVIMGNPPYRAKQDNEDGNLNRVSYPNLDRSLQKKWVETSSAINKTGLMDYYIRAIRWSADRLNGYGVVGFITNSSFIDGVAMDGMRKSLQKEFSDIYIINLKGQIRRRNREQAKIEGGNIFDIMTGVAITIFVKAGSEDNEGNIHYYNIGDGLSKDEKLNKLSNLVSINNISFEKI